MTRLNTIDAEGCAKEPIHLSGAIQAHGYLVSCAMPDWTVRHASANVEDLLGASVDELLGRSLRDYASEEVLQAILDTLSMVTPGNTTAQRAGQANLGPLGTACDLVVHVADDLVHIEIEPRYERGLSPQPTVLAQSMIGAVAHEPPENFHEFVAAQVRGLTGYDRVMVYRFLPDGTGDVIAEARADDMEPYLGLRFPASDIPPQARALYLRNRVRVIPDVDYEPVPIVPGTVDDGRPLDLSQHALRSVSPVHLEYLRNMGVGASMSISIIAGGRLWGLIACHHRVPRLVPPAVRAAADLFGLFVSMRVASAEQQRTLAHFEHAQQVRDALVLRLAQARDFDRALMDELPLLRTALGADGAALWSQSRWHASGQTPDPRRVASLVDWLQQQGAVSVAVTDTAADWAAPMDGDATAGVLALRLGADDWLLLFRDEQVQTVNWAGEPAKALVPTDDGLRIAPRRSFAVWRESVRGRSAPWSDADRRGAARLHQVLTEQRRRIQTRVDVPALDQQRRQAAMDERRQRLDQLAQMLEGLSHLAPDVSARLDARISALEDELQRLAEVAPLTDVA
ncbi:GAF domain-containing protein [Lysobacter sp. TY2-98]|uniref:GAF domain-containing protein n=1 Tax=Lysobacter sp. TY2-98 TaxID=2290922 RepID=UPI000E1FBC09|nr:GAF domain-containing protein [Lysobacter sp. TY2-98]AXK73044.1 GAF domain-containing protein [Lysobacter sp. TY2-98]